MPRHLFLLGVIVSLCFSNSYAGHAGTMEINYRWVSDSTYQVSLIFYRNCQGVGSPAGATIRATSSNLGRTVSASLSRLATSGTGVPPLNPDEMYNCTASSSLCYEEYVYRGNITLSGKARDWIFNYSLCTVPPEIDNVGGTNCLYAEAGLNNLDFPDTSARNWSPIFHNRRPNLPGYSSDTVKNYPLYTACEGRTIELKQNAKEYQGDRVKYELINPRSTSGVPMSYASPYSFNYPLPVDTPPSLSIDTATGTIWYKPVAPSVRKGSEDLFLVAIQATEYRKDTTIVQGNPVVKEIEIGFVTRNLLINTTADSLCPDLDISFADTSKPSTSSADIELPCRNNVLAFAFTEPVTCQSIDTNGSLIHVIDSNGQVIPATKAQAINCDLRGVTNKIEVTLSSTIQSGTYYLMLKQGHDSNTVLTECGMELKAYDDTLIVKVLSKPIGRMMGDHNGFGPNDSITLECYRPTYLLKLSEYIDVNSIDSAYRQFNIAEEDYSQYYPVDSVQAVSPSNGETKNLKVFMPHLLPGRYYLYLDANDNVTNVCGDEWERDSLVVRIEEVAVDLGPDTVFCEGEAFTYPIFLSGYSGYIWNGDPNDTLSVYNIKSPGTYTVEVFNQYGCSGFDTVVVSEEDCYVGIGENKNGVISVYPNPTEGKVVIELDEIYDQLSIDVLTVDGRMVGQHSFNSTKKLEFNIDGNPGIYFIHLSSGVEQLGRLRILKN